MLTSIMSEFQVIVLAGGKGSRYREITTRRPKCLLPIGNNPMVYYPIKMFEKAGFKELFVVVYETAKSEVEFALEQTDLSIKCNVITIPWDDKGTADSLRHLGSYITSDFIVVSCDLLTTFDIKSVLDSHRKHDASITALYFRNSSPDLNFITPGPKSKNKAEKDLVGVDPTTSRLVFLASASDYEDTLRLKRTLLCKHGRVRMFTTLLDSHIYVMKKWLIKYLAFDENLSTVKGELIPHVLRMQRSPKNKLMATDPSLEVTPVKNQYDNNNLDIFALARDVEYDSTAQSMSSFNDHNGDLCPVYLNDNIKCYGFIADNEFALRCNTLRDFCKANKLIAEKWKAFVNNESSNISAKAKISSSQLDKNTCFVGSNCEIAAKTSISESTFGTGCVVQEKTKITGCVVMNNVKIADGCSLSNCVICDDVTIESNCTLKDCLVGSGYTVIKTSLHTNEIIAEGDSLMEV